MAAKSRMRIESRFPAVKKAAHEVVQRARDRALDVGENEAETKLGRLNDSRGYNLPEDIEQEHIGFQSGKITYPEFFGRWFEYGSVYIAPFPFMRPAHRKMKKEFTEVMGDDMEPWIRRRVGRFR